MNAGPPFVSAWAETDEELTDFRSRCGAALGVHFPLSYLKQGRVRVFRDRGGQLVGGYALILKGPFRTLASIPDSAGFTPTFSESELFEVTALWLDRAVPPGRFRTWVWWTFARDLATQPGKRWYVYSYDLRKKKKLGETFRAISRPRVLYEGPVKELEGMSGPSAEAVELGSCFRVKLFPLLALPNLVVKLVFDRGRVRHLFRARDGARVTARDEARRDG